MQAEIIIDELSINAIIGCHDSERTTKQLLQLSMALQTDITTPSKSDDIDDAINYDSLTKKIKAHVEQSSYHLIETLAETIATLVLEDKRIQKVSVLLYKPQALSSAKRVGIKILRENKQINSNQTSKKLNWN